MAYKLKLSFYRKPILISLTTLNCVEDGSHNLFLFSSRARGVAILIHKDIYFNPSDVLADRNGRYIIVSGLLFNTPVVLANIYAPNFDDHNFLLLSFFLFYQIYIQAI